MTKLKHAIKKIMRPLLNRFLKNEANSSGSAPLPLCDLISNHVISLYNSTEYNDAFAEIIRKGVSHNSSILYDAAIFSKFSRTIHTYSQQIPETTLQIGPGGSLGCEVLFCLSGIMNAWSLDPYTHLKFDFAKFMATLQKFFDVMNNFQTIHDRAAPRFTIPEYSVATASSYRIGKSSMQHFPSSTFESTGLPNDSIDFLFSNAVLEHARDPLQCVRETMRVLRKNGITAHQIDLRDHRDFSKPLLFLKHSDAQWQTIMQEYCAVDPFMYMNRWRSQDFVEIFEKEGFRILEVTPNMTADDTTVDKALPCLDDRFKNYPRSELGTISLFIVAEKT